MRELKNGLYLTTEDAPNFNDEINKLYPSYNTYFKGNKRADEIAAFNVTFVVTEACNLNCTYCYETHKTNKVMTKETAKEAVDFLLSGKLGDYCDLEEKPCVVLEFIGGEPFLNIDVIDYTVEYFRKRTIELDHPWKDSFMVSMTSNGTLYFDEKVQDFIERNKSILSLGITIDGNKELHDKCRLFYDGRGSYDLAEAAITDWISRLGSYSDTKITLAPENVECLFEAVKNVFDLGVNFAYTNCCFEEGWTEEHAEILEREMVKLADYIIDNELYKVHYCSLFDESIGVPLTETRNFCGGNGDMLAIGTDGKLYPCIRFMQYSLNNQPEKAMGTIYEGITDTEFVCELKKIDMVSQCQFDDNRKCLTCEVAQGCALCTGYNYDHYGDPNHKAVNICCMHKARVRANNYFWKKLKAKLKER